MPLAPALVTLSEEGASIAARLARHWPESRVFVHEDVATLPDGLAAQQFPRIADLTQRLFSQYRALVFIAPTGVVVRAIAPCLEHKSTDPAVVAVDVRARWAVSLVGGHEGGANTLAFAVANVLGAEPIVTTTTEARKDLIVGIGCRRGAAPEIIVRAVGDALAGAGLPLARVRMLASADIKAEEPGLAEAAARLGLPLRLVSSAELVDSLRDFEHSDFVREKVDLPAVAEPAALLAGRRTRFVLRKTVYHGVTVAIARESSLPSE
jgi:cobalt-precorrin 5A hydrolase